MDVCIVLLGEALIFSPLEAIPSSWPVGINNADGGQTACICTCHHWRFRISIMPLTWGNAPRKITKDHWCNTISDYKAVSLNVANYVIVFPSKQMFTCRVLALYSPTYAKMASISFQNDISSLQKRLIILGMYYYHEGSNLLHVLLAQLMTWTIDVT